MKERNSTRKLKQTCISLLIHMIYFTGFKLPKAVRDTKQNVKDLE